MTTKKRNWSRALLPGLFALLAIMGCGGGSSDRPSPAPAPPSTPPLIITTASLPDGKEGEAYSATLTASGGSGARSWAISAGALPDSLALESPTGVVSGEPSKDGVFNFTVQVTDSGSPPHAISKQLSINVKDRSVLGRNDSIATATKFKTDGNSTLRASLSPYGDPAGSANADTDFYQLVAKAGARVTIEIRAKRLSQSNPLDSAIEIVDQNGVRFTTCKDEGELSGVDGEPDPTPDAFDDVCLNDDVELGVSQDSKLQFQIPSNLGNNVALYVHVLDWSGSARPDMIYDLTVQGAE